ncbi:conserved hypothetical protein [uncultured Paludibacter sp.]|nr:conserved hypothetical protein [uncultured Paludibacter sp.]
MNKTKPYYKKSESIKQFEKDYQDWYYTGKDIPYKVPFKFRDDKANELTKLILAYLSFKGYFGARINTTGIYDQRREMWRKSGGKKGMADVTAVINGKHISIEIKAGKDKPRPEQLKVAEQIQQAGGEYWFIHSFDEFLKYENNIKIH